MTDLLRYLVERGSLVQTEGTWRVGGRAARPFAGAARIGARNDRAQARSARRLRSATARGRGRSRLRVRFADCRRRLRHAIRPKRITGSNSSSASMAWCEWCARTNCPMAALSIRYSFVHILHQQAMYHDLLPTRRAALSLALAHAIENRYGKDNPAMAAELACLFEEGARSASVGPPVVAGLAQRRPRFCPRRSHRARAPRHRPAAEVAGIAEKTPTLELKLQTTLGLQLQVKHGYAEPAAKLAYERARRLCREGSHVRCFPSSGGCGCFTRSALNCHGSATGRRVVRPRADFERSRSCASSASGAGHDGFLPWDSCHVARPR